MVLRCGEIWINPLGIESLTLVDFVVTADVSTVKLDKAKAQITQNTALEEGGGRKFPGSWAFNTTVIFLKGELFAATRPTDFSWIEGTMQKVTFDKIKELAKAVHNYELQTPMQKLEFDSIELWGLTVGNRLLEFGWVEKDSESQENSETFQSQRQNLLQDCEFDFVIAKRRKDDTSDPFALGGASEKNPEKAIEGDTKDGKSSTEKPVDNARDDREVKDADNKDKASGKPNAEKAAVPANEVATNTDKTPMQKQEIAINDMTCFKTDAKEKLKAYITLSMGYSSKGRLQVVAAGKVRTFVSLRTIIDDSIKPGSFLDCQLSEFTVYGTNMDEAYLPPEIWRYQVTKGFYLSAVLDRVPMLQEDGEPNKALKKSNLEDCPYKKIRFEKNKKVFKVAVFLPPSYKKNASTREQFGWRLTDTTPICKFKGDLFIRMEEDREKPIKVSLELGVDGLTGSLGILMNKADAIVDPLSLSKAVRLYDLGGSVSIEWPVFLASGVLNSLGFKALLTVDKAFNSKLGESKLNENLTKIVQGVGAAKVLGIQEGISTDKIADAIKTLKDDRNIKADTLNFVQIGAFIASKIGDDTIVIPNIDLISFKDVNIYASLGYTYLDTWYPMGTRFKDKIQIYDWYASMDAEQAFKLSSMIEIFDSYVLADINIQFMPHRIFYFNFELLWSAGLYIKVTAEMISV
ncbi:hypothetical protein M501DRAFT_1019958 [Patellaria atrata CBS 101060]|uniref:Uncharacterized protein n=1 Tax=Patellaria atrata CBS 101060 TaxID=1346257 RepID=A0A9P4S3C7_9PEZI|nr:hypothetical protein M501DRAFT_1019958 [Patellaria atrata CBS 101060]